MECPGGLCHHRTLTREVGGLRGEEVWSREQSEGQRGAGGCCSEDRGRGPELLEAEKGQECRPSPAPQSLQRELAP